MALYSIFAIAIALAMDAFAVALATGFTLRCASLSQTMRMATMFGVCQFVMPLIGWLLGVKAQKYIEAYDHWIAFALLAFVALHMLKEAWENKNNQLDACSCPPDRTQGFSLWLLGIATSIDALAVGLSFAILQVSILTPAIIIGIVCFILTAIGMHIGRLVCRLPGLTTLGNKANILGGLVLLGISLKILVEHGVFG